MQKNSTLRLAFVIICCCVCLLPYLLMLVSAFNTSVDIKSGNIFKNMSIQMLGNNLNHLMQNDGFWESILNTFYVAVSVTLIGTLASAMASYAIILTKSKMSNILFLLVIASALVPSATIVVPLFMMLQKLRMLDSLFTVVIVSLPISFATFIIVQNAKEFPEDLVKAAKIDGMNNVLIFFKVYIPTIKSILITVLTITFIDAWNSFMCPLIVIQSRKKMTISLFLNNMGANQNSDYGVFMLALFVSTLPTIGLLIMFQKYYKMGVRESE